MAQITPISSPNRLPKSAKPVFYLLAGPNGAGKSTLYKALTLQGTIPPDVEFINADLYEAAHLQHIADLRARSEAARMWADARRAELLKASQSFVSETVFSHESKLGLLQEAQQSGFFVMLIVVCLDDPQTLIARVASRVEEGGHAVPHERILARYPRTLANLAVGVRVADLAILYDSEAVSPGTHKMVAICRGQLTDEKADPLPAWAEKVLNKGKQRY
jgi:predicted ABC-type ATPase